MTTRLLRVAAVLTVAMGASACSTLPDWVDPWSSDTPSAQSDNATTPDLADIPNRPAPASTPDDQRQVTDSLAADRAQTNYSAERLRAGDETGAPPPAPMSAAEQQAAHAAAQTPPPSAAAPAPASNDTATPAPSNQSSSAAPPSDASASAAPASETADAAAPAPQQQAADAGPQPQAAQSAPPPGAEPAVPMSSGASNTQPMRNYVAAVNPSDAALGFKPSTAPPLDPSVAQFVPAPIIAHYQQTAAWAGSAGASSAITNSGSPAPRHVRNSRRGVGGPERMSGAVVANLDALQSAGASPAAYSPAAGTPTAVVFFPGDGTVLNAEGREQVRQAVEAFKASGGQGYVRVIGHSSSRTANMPVEKHLELIFERSKQRADTVARELIRQGIPAARVLEEAVGDSQPVYYESMPKGEDGNRRAEIFLQG
jgi:outer membrane protein OmpA-like peptidoglycan-associated protein